MSFFIINKEVCHWSRHIFLLVVKTLLILRIVIFIGDTLSVLFLAIYLSALFMFLPPWGALIFQQRAPSIFSSTGSPLMSCLE